LKNAIFNVLDEQDHQPNQSESIDRECRRKLG
jgi:hypothetical protein